MSESPGEIVPLRRIKAEGEGKREPKRMVTMIKSEFERRGSYNTNSRSKFTARERNLTLAVVLLCIICFGIVAFFTVQGPLSSLLINKFIEDFSFKNGICDTSICVKIADRAINSGNFSSGPCRDFFHYSCIKWQNQHPVKSESLINAANINNIQDRVDLQLKKLLEKEGGEQSDIESEKLFRPLRNFYKSCLTISNSSNLVNEENELISDLISTIGGYSKAASWKDANFDLTSTLIDLFKINAAPLFDLTLDIDAKNRSYYSIIIDLPNKANLVPNLFRQRSKENFMESFLQNNSPDNDIQVTFNSTELLNKKWAQNDSKSTVLEREIIYKTIMEKVEGKKVEQLKSLARKVGHLMNVSEDELNEDIRQISQILQNLKTLIPSQKIRKFWKQKNRVYNEHTIESLEKQFGQINWRRLFTELVGQQKKPGTNQTIDWLKKKVIYVAFPGYLRQVLQSVEYTNKRLLYNTFTLMFVQDILDDILKRDNNPETRWKFCVQSAKSVFAMELSALYLRSFDWDHLKKVQSEVEEIFISVKESLLGFLHRSIWLEKDTKNEAIRKIQTLKGNFLSPTFYLKKDFVDYPLKDVQMNPANFFSNVRLVYKIYRRELYKLYHKHVDEERATWSLVTFPFIVNAFYIQQFNSIVIPMAFLSPPNYYFQAPAYINFASLGLTIAHEAIHSLDGSGKDFNAEGVLVNWWNEPSKKSMEEKSSCVANQYSKHFSKVINFYQTHVKVKIDGNLTKNENLADIEGLKIAYDAYINYRKKWPIIRYENEKKLPGLNFNLDQIFFITVGQTYCANVSPLGYIIMLEVDEHSPHPERINGMMMNNEEFAKAFECSIGGPMNAEEKCSLF